jgi:tripeptidyl-peptidase-1
LRLAPAVLLIRRLDASTALSRASPHREALKPSAYMMRVLALALAAASAQAVIVHPGPLPTEWLAAPLPASATAQEIRFSVALREQNMAELKRIALAVSDPQSPEYGNHRSAAAVAELTAPTAADTATVRSWLAASACNVVAEHSTDRLFAVRCSAAAASELLATSFRTLSNAATGQSVTKATEFSLPDDVAAATDAVFGLHGLPLPPRPRRAAPSAASVWENVQNVAPPKAAANVTPAVIADVYNVGGVKVDRSSKNKQAVAEFQGQTYNSTDLDTFFSLCECDT